MSTDSVTISNRLLATIISAAFALSLLCWLLWPQPPHFAARSGSAALMLVALVGSLLLIASATAAVAKRSGHGARRFYRAHVWLAAIGFLLVAIHSKGNLTRPPALLLALLAALMVLGYWARSYGAAAMATTFGRKHAGFVAPAAEDTNRLRELIDTKKSLLQRIDRNADEALFSLTPSHWLKTPRLAFAYHRAVIQENTIVGTRRSVRPLQAWWRVLHQLLAVGFIVGLLLHVILVLFFAGYVADGNEVYWWHLFAWDLF